MSGTTYRLIGLLVIAADLLITGSLVWAALSGSWAERLALWLGVDSREGGYHIRAFTLMGGAFMPTIALCIAMMRLGM